VRSDRPVIGSSGAQPLVGRVVPRVLQHRRLPLDPESVRIEETPVLIDAQSNPVGETLFVEPERPKKPATPYSKSPSGSKPSRRCIVAD